MKKTAKGLLLIVFITILVFTLTGCGSKNNKKEDNKDTLVATKNESDDYFGEYKQIVEITFKDEKAETIVMTYDFDNEETAKGIASIFSLAGSEDLQGIETKQDGNKFIMTMNAQAYAEQQNIEEENLSKEYLKDALEKDGYEIQ